jgi:hypothetical protein
MAFESLFFQPSQAVFSMAKMDSLVGAAAAGPAVFVLATVFAVLALLFAVLAPLFAVYVPESHPRQPITVYGVP